MSDLLNKFSIFSEISDDLKKNIKYFHVFDCGDSVLFVTIDDRVYGCGFNTYGWLGFGDNNDVFSVCEVIELRNQRITRFHIGVDFVIALSNNNKLFSWGTNDYGQLGRGYANDENKILKPSSITMFDNVKIKQIDNDLNTITILTDDRKVYVWGNNEYKQCDDYSDYVITPIEKIFPNGVIIESIFVCIKNSFAITNNGNVYIWGINNDVSAETLNEASIPRLIDAIGNVKNIGYNNFKTFFLTYDNKYLIEKFGHFKEVNCSGHIIDKIITYKPILYGYYDSWFIDNNDAVYKISSNEDDLYLLEKSIFDCFTKEQVTFETIELKKVINRKVDIGHGGFGKVFKCVRYGREYAIKKIEMFRIDRDLMDKNSEINIMWKLSSEYIANLYDYWIEKTNDGDEFLYLEMEICDCNLKNFFTKLNLLNNLPDEIIFIIEFEILKQIFESVNYLHQNKVIHRDLKPSNILIKLNLSNGRFIKLCDFGLSVNHEWSKMSHTPYVGTGVYIATEVKNGEKYTEKADIYSLGIIMEKDFKLLSMNKLNARDYLNGVEKLKNLFIDDDPTKRPNWNDIFNTFKNPCFGKFINISKYTIRGFVHYESNNYPEEVINILKIIEQHSSF